MQRYVAATLTTLLALSPLPVMAGASVPGGMSSDASNATLPGARNNLGLGLDIYLSPSGGDDTAALSAAVTGAIATAACVRLNQGVFTISSQSWASGACVIGAGRDKTTIRRAASAATGTLITLSGHSYLIADLTVDGNKTSQTNGSNNIGITGAYYDVKLRHIRTTGAKTASGWGSGINFSGAGADGTHNTESEIDGVLLDANDATGASLSADDIFTVTGSRFLANGGDGLSVQNGTVPSGITVTRLKIVNNQFDGNGGGGVNIGSFVASVGSLGNVPGPNPVAANVTITGNEASGNGASGIGFQGADGVITGNDLHGNGTTNSAGLLLNATRVTVTGNAIYGNISYGIDAGGCTNCSIKSNQIHDNTGTGIHTGASTNVVIANNFVWGNPTDIGVSRTDFGGGSWFKTVTSGLLVEGNDISLTTGSELGIQTVNNAQIAVYDNKCSLGASGVSTNCYQFVATQNAADSHGNEIIAAAGATSIPLASAATLVIPDGGTLFAITGTTTITNLLTSSANTYNQKLIGVTMTAPGTGANGSEIVTFTGGGCSVEPTGTPQVVNDGTIVGVTITGNGTGCASAPACAISGGTSSGATCTAIVYASNFFNRDIDLLFTNAAGISVTSTNFISLVSGNFSSSAAYGHLRLRGSAASGTWVEVNRSTNAGATAQAQPGNPTGTTDTTGKMMGLAGSITPAYSGKIKLTISGTIFNPTAIADGAKVQASYGTGTAPTNGAAITGTQCGGRPQYLAATTAAKAPFSVNCVVTGLTVGTAYWLDVTLAAITGGTATISDVSISATELR